MKEIITSNGYRVQVDDEDFNYLDRWSWSAYKSHVQRTSTLDDGKQISVYMHRAIYEKHNITIKEGFSIDHKDRNPLNNQKENLRLATKSQNGANVIYNTGSTSEFRGVYYSERRRKWHAHITLIHLETFKTEIEAAKAYNRAAKVYRGEFAILNIIKENES